MEYKQVVGGTAKEEIYPDTTITEFRFPNLETGITYRFRVYAINKGGMGEPAEAHYTIVSAEGMFVFLSDMKSRLWVNY